MEKTLDNLKAEIERRFGTDYQDLGHAEEDLVGWLEVFNDIEEIIDWMIDKSGLVDITQPY